MKLKEALEKKKFVVTSEVQAPMGDDDPEALRARLDLAVALAVACGYPPVYQVR